MTLGAIHVSQVPQSGWPRPLTPPIGCNLSTNRKRKPKWRRCVAASIAFGPVEDRRNNRRLATVTCTLCVLQIWWLSHFTFNLHLFLPGRVQFCDSVRQLPEPLL